MATSERVTKVDASSNDSDRKRKVKLSRDDKRSYDRWEMVSVLRLDAGRRVSKLGAERKVKVLSMGNATMIKLPIVQPEPDFLRVLLRLGRRRTCSGRWLAGWAALVSIAMSLIPRNGATRSTAKSHPGLTIGASMGL